MSTLKNFCVGIILGLPIVVGVETSRHKAVRETLDGIRDSQQRLETDLRYVREWGRQQQLKNDHRWAQLLNDPGEVEAGDVIRPGFKPLGQAPPDVGDSEPTPVEGGE